MINFEDWKKAMAEAVAADLMAEQEAKKRAGDPATPVRMRRPRKQGVELGPVPALLERAPKGARVEKDRHALPDGDHDAAHWARHVLAVARQRKARGLVLETPEKDAISVTLVF